ncbi:MAG: hypothetical protein HFJ10_00030 [Lachnospiraceae bacterium]|nr:hypothetical protein [Lachnospiraceae bacterium]
MCHKPKKESALELPPSCRAAADKMEQALREEDTASYPIAKLSASSISVISKAEDQLRKELGKDIVLIAHEAR